jgi:DNA-binding GntR family transcriptional regulator
MMASDDARYTRPSPDGVGARAERIARQLSDQVDEGLVLAGTWLRQEKLAEDFDVSRTAIRDAIQLLHARGVVELIPNRGARIRQFSERDIQESYQVRAQLEGFAAELAAARATTDELARLRVADELFEHAVSARVRGGASLGGSRETQGLDWAHANDLFHGVVQDAACNDRLRQAINDQLRSFPRILAWQALGADLRLLQENVAQHRAIRDAIGIGDSAVARQLMVSHINRAGELVALRVARRQTGAGRA